MRFAAGAGLLFALTALACSDPTNIEDLLRVARVDVDPPNASVTIGATLQLAATPRTQSGIILNDRPVTWSSSDETLAEVSSTGVVTAKGVGGPVEIRATVDDVLGNASILISAEPITRITVAPSQTAINVGSSTQLQATAYNSSGQVVSGATFTWQSSNPGIADVSTSGIILGITAGGPVTITARSGGISGTASVSVAQAQAIPNGLAFTDQPPNGTAGQPLPEPVRVAIRDAAGNTVNSDVPVSVRLGNNPTGATLSGTLTVPASSGVATFTNLVINKAGTDYTLVAYSGGLTDAISASFDIAAPPVLPPNLSIASPPSSSAESGVQFAQQPAIRVSTALGTPVSGVAVSATIASGGGTLSGTTTVISDANGLATYTNLAITGSDGYRTLQFSAPGATSVTSNPIAVSNPPPPPPPPSGPPALSIQTQPSSSAQSGSPFAQQPVIRMRDGANNPVSGVVVTASIASGGGTLDGNPAKTTDANGLAPFADLGITGSPGNRTLRFDALNATGVISSTIAITAAPAPPAALAMAVQPSSLAVRNLAFPQQPVIQVVDASGQAVRQAGINVTAEKASGPGRGNLGGTKTISTNASGQAVFTDLSFNRSGTYTLRFTAPGLQSVTSNSILIP
jgi:hypothetical protein